MTTVTYEHPPVPVKTEDMWFLVTAAIIGLLAIWDGLGSEQY